MSVWDWSDDVAAVPAEHRISLGEGNTPLVRSRRIGPAAKIPNLYFKLESSNPTGSYKDRFAALAISDMRARGRSRCVATSSGNTGAALAAYSAAAGMTCEIAIVETAPVGKTVQMLAYGAQLFRIQGFGLDPEITQRAMNAARARGGAADAAFQISAFHFSPVGMSGVQTISYEIARQLPAAITHVFTCAGGGGLTLAVARGFQRLVTTGRLARMPAIECVQPEGNATIAGPLRRGGSKAEEVTCTTSVSGLQVPNVIDGDFTLAACRESGGTGHLVSDAEVWKVQADLAREEGIFCEPAAAVSLAGALRAAAEGQLPQDAVVVCLVTGSGFKDAVSAERMVAGREPQTVTVEEYCGV
jgi:threonine synthase